MSHNLSQRIFVFLKVLLGWFRVGVGKGGLSHFIYLFYKLLYRYVVKFNLKTPFQSIVIFLEQVCHLKYCCFYLLIKMSVENSTILYFYEVLSMLRLYTGNITKWLG